MARKDRHPLFYFTIFVVIVFILSGAIYFMLPVKQTAYFYDEDVGIIETQITVYNKWNRWMGFFQQQAFPVQGNIDLGEQAVIRDLYTVTSTAIWGVRIEYNKPGESGWSNSLGVLCNFSLLGSPLYVIGDQIDIQMSFYPDVVGSYTFRTLYWTDPPSSQTTCTWTTTPIIDSSPGILTVNPVVPNCNLQPRWQPDWTYDKDTTDGNGMIDKRTWQILDNNCNYQDDHDEYRTRCNTNYQIVGTAGSTNRVGELSCELIPVTNACTNDTACGGQICVSNTCVAYECPDSTHEVTSICPSDNSTLIVQTCVNNRLVATGNTCTNATTNTTATTISCWQALPLTQQAVVGTRDCERVNITATECTGKYYDTDADCILGSDPDDPDGVNYALIALISGLVIMLGIVGWLVYRRYFKK